ncbi:MAG TPA: cation:proton antiporter [Syntrophomonas sp.]|jgi:multicomponent Na+:H+ antiporter subunit F|nr:cation:proton antiporter [Syntrophomonas sp.]
MFEFTIVVIVISAFLTLYRMVKGPTIYDRILTANIIGTKTVVVIILAGFVFKNPQFFIDIALVYVLINFILVLAFLKYVEKGRLD